MRRTQTRLYQRQFGPPPVIIPIPAPNYFGARPFSEPQRYRGGYPDARYSTALAASGEVPFPAVQPSIDARTARWYQQWVDPPRILKDPDNAVQAASGLTFAAAVQPSIDARNARWFQPLSEPRREYRYVARITGEIAWPFFQAFITPVDQTNSWHRPLSEPVRYPRDRRFTAVFAAGEVQWPYNQPAADNANVRWLVPFSLPVRFPRDPRYTATLDASGEPKWAYNQPATDNANARWWRPFSEPQRFKRDPTATIALFASGEAPRSIAQFIADNANVRWHSPFSEPQRFKRDPRFATTLDASGYVVRADTVFIDANVRWFAPFSLPVRYAREPRYETALYASGQYPWSLIAPNTVPTGGPVLHGNHSQRYWRALYYRKTVIPAVRDLN